MKNNISQESRQTYAKNIGNTKGQKFCRGHLAGKKNDKLIQQRDQTIREIAPKFGPK